MREEKERKRRESRGWRDSGFVARLRQMGRVAGRNKSTPRYSAE